MKIKILITGGDGQLGKAFTQCLQEKNIEFLSLNKNKIDVTNFEGCYKCINEINPTVIINCAAYTDVENAEIERDKCYNINVLGTINLTKICKLLNIPLVFISSDYIFSGEKEGYYNTDDYYSPINFYGYTKALGEIIVKKNLEKFFIIRTSWLYDNKSKNFLTTMLKLSETKNELNIIADQFGSPTYTIDLAKAIIEVIHTDKYGIYHITNDGICSWADFAEEIFKTAHKNVIINRINTTQYKCKARRPLNSRLSKNMLNENGFQILPEWKNALSRCIYHKK